MFFPKFLNRDQEIPTYRDITLGSELTLNRFTREGIEKKFPDITGSRYTVIAFFDGTTITRLKSGPLSHVDIDPPYNTLSLLNMNYRNTIVVLPENLWEQRAVNVVRYSQSEISSFERGAYMCSIIENYINSSHIGTIREYRQDNYLLCKELMYGMGRGDIDIRKKVKPTVKDVLYGSPDGRTIGTYET